MHAPPSDASAAGAKPLEAAVGDALDELRTFRHRIWAPVLLGLIMLFDSWDSIAIAYVMPSLVKAWSLSPTIMGLLISSGYVGQFLGAIVLGGIAERVGRMPVFVGAVVLMGGLALACAFSPGYEVLLPVRFVQGLAIGGALPVSISYINELAPSQTRGRYFSLFQWICMSGYAASSISSTIVIPHLGWRWLFGFGVTPLVLLPLVLLTLPESPRWLARAGRLEAVDKALKKLGGGPISNAYPDIPAAAAPGRPPQVRMSALFRAPYGRRTLMLIALWFLTSFANFGLTTWAPSIYTTVFKLPLADALRFSAAPTVLFLVVTTIVGPLLDSVGRRPFAILGALVAAGTLLALAWHPPERTALLAGLIIAGSLATSMGAFILWPFSAENYPTSIRAIGLGICSSTARAASMLTPLFVGVILAQSGSIRLVFGVFGAFSVVALAIWIIGARETARVRLENL